MTDKNKVKNSLLTAASTGFSLDDFSDARIVPVAIQQEILKNTPEATAEIDLNDDGGTETIKPFFVPTSATTTTSEVTSNLQSLSFFDNLRSKEPTTVVRDSTFIPYFNKPAGAEENNDPLASILPVSLVPPTASVSSTRPQLSPLPPPPEVSTTVGATLTSVPLGAESIIPASVSLFPVGSSSSAQQSLTNDPFTSSSSASLLSNFQSKPPLAVSAAFNLTSESSSLPTILPPSSSAQAPPSLTTTTNTFNVFNPPSSGGTPDPAAVTTSAISTSTSIGSTENLVSHPSPSIFSPSSVSSSFTPTGSSISNSPSPIPTLFSPTSSSVADTVTTNTTTTTSSATTATFSNSVNAPSSTQAQDVGAGSTGNVQTQGLSNKYRIGATKRLQYAQYPGLNVANAPTPQIPMATMGNVNSQPPLPPSSSAAAALAPLVGGPSNSTPISPSYPQQEYAGTGYVFGEPPPVKTAIPTPNPVQYSPVQYHWFYHKEVEGKGIWKPFSFLDSVALEEAFTSGSKTAVPTDGGRYDTDVHTRLRTPVFWEEAPSEVRRASWFYKGPLDNRFIPYEEDFAQQIEDEFKAAINTGVWQRRVELGSGEAIILHNANIVVHFCQAASPDEWGNLPENQLRPRVVKRGVDKSFLIEDGESTQIDHLVFIVHGIGAICDFKFRSIVEAVDDFRSLSAQLLHTHFNTAFEKGLVGRIEFLPVSWHTVLHGDCGVDRKLKPITLHSIPKLRHFTNDTLLDILFYTSPVYCQRIVDTVGNEINRMYDLFMKRNLHYDGSVSLCGHSLGSLILFDLLQHQPVNLTALAKSDGPINSQESSQNESADQAGDGVTKDVLKSFTIGHAGTGQPSIVYPTFNFHPTCFFAMGSPTAVFISVRGIDQLGDDFHFPTCQSFFNIFHPYDPVAYRMETLIDPTFPHPPVVIPHHKGRKRFHLEIKDAMFRMGTDLKATMIDTFKNTWKTFYNLTSFAKNDDLKLEQEIDRALEGELSKSVDDQHINETHAPNEEQITIGKLNGGRRLDYVLQEAPLESFNEYLFALSSHVCYWESEDTMLLLMREMYQTIGVFVDNHPLVSTGPTGQHVTSPVSEQSTSTSDFQQQQQQGFSQYTSTPSFYSPTSESTSMFPSPPMASVTTGTTSNPYSSQYNISPFAPPPPTSAAIPSFVQPAIRPYYRHPTSLNHPVLKPNLNTFIPNTSSASPPTIPHSVTPTPPQNSEPFQQQNIGPPPLTGFMRKN